MVLALLFAPEDLEPATLLALDQLVARIDVRRPEAAPQPDALMTMASASPAPPDAPRADAASVCGASSGHQASMFRRASSSAPS